MYAVPNICVLVDHLERFIPCLLHIGGKTGTEIVLKRFEQHCSEACMAGPTTFIALSTLHRGLPQVVYRVIVPYLRGYGRTRFLSSDTFRNGQQAEVAVDIIALLDALRIGKAIFAFFDWGARMADIIAAILPEGCKVLVPVSGYLIGSQATGKVSLPPQVEPQCWYEYYFATERGRAGYEQFRRDFAMLIWRADSPKWDFDDVTFEHRAAAFDNPDHVRIVIHNYRRRLGLAEGEPKYDGLEQRLTAAPLISEPTIRLEGNANGAPHPDASPCSSARKC